MLTVRTISSRCDLRRFITFPEKLYKDNPYWVPSLHTDEFNALGDKNPCWRTVRSCGGAAM